jgi:hypothetical protein
MNPFTMGPLAMSAWSNPDLFATAMAAQGVAPNQVLNPNVPLSMDQMDPMAAFLTPSANTGSPAAAAPVADPAVASPLAGLAPNALASLGQLGKVVAPQASPAPLMNAGVSGSQKAPEVQVSAPNNMQNAIMKMILNARGSGGAGVPGLPGLMKGI